MRRVLAIMMCGWALAGLASSACTNERPREPVGFRGSSSEGEAEAPREQAGSGHRSDSEGVVDERLLAQNGDPIVRLTITGPPQGGFETAAGDGKVVCPAEVTAVHAGDFPIGLVNVVCAVDTEDESSLLWLTSEPLAVGSHGDVALAGPWPDEQIVGAELTYDVFSLLPVELVGVEDVEHGAAASSLARPEGPEFDSVASIDLAKYRQMEEGVP